MVLHPEEVKTVAADTFAKQFRKRDTHLDQLNPFWRNIYKVQHHNQKIFEPLCDPFDLEEWNETIHDLSKRSSAGPSGIDYNIIRKLPESFVLILLKFFNFCFLNSRNPTAWKQSTIIPIPKPNKFAFNIANTRPIALLDTFWKVNTKMITKRLTSILTTNKILQGRNFCGLNHATVYLE